jgi:hypothetical protein
MPQRIVEDRLPGLAARVPRVESPSATGLRSAPGSTAPTAPACAAGRRRGWPAPARPCPAARACAPPAPTPPASIAHRSVPAASPACRPSSASSGWPVSCSTSVSVCTARVIATYSAVDVELVELQRLVGLVLGAPVVEFLGLQVFSAHALADLGIGLALARHQPEQQHVRVLQALGLVHAEDQRRVEGLSGGGLVLVAQHDHGVRADCAWPRPAAPASCPSHQQPHLAGLAEVLRTRKLLSRSTEPKRACLIFSSRLASLGDRACVAEVGLQQLQAAAAAPHRRPGPARTGSSAPPS